MHERTHGLEKAVEDSAEMVRLVLGQDVPDANLLSKQTVWDFDHHFTPGLVRYRKSVTESGDYAALEWDGEGSIVRDLLGREWIDCLGGYGIYDLGIRNPEVLAAVRAQLDRNPMPTQELLDPLKGCCAGCSPRYRLGNSRTRSSATQERKRSRAR
jgi:putrescine aminotransferase